MANVKISESDFEMLHFAANLAMKNGDTAEALKLDKLARKTSAALSNAKLREMRKLGAPTVKGLTWQEVPSTIIGVL